MATLVVHEQIVRVLADIDPSNEKGQQVPRRFRERYDYLTLSWYVGLAYYNVHITAECLRRTGDDQDADGFRDCLHGIIWSWAIGDNYSFDEYGEVVGLAKVVGRYPAGGPAHECEQRLPGPRPGSQVIRQLHWPRPASGSGVSERRETSLRTPNA